MELTPEERRKIYEEEKAKIEAGEQPEKEKGDTASDTSVNLPPRVAGLLCYLGAWVTGIIFFIIEQKNRWVRFHAAQSIVVFGVISIAGAILGWIPFIGDFFSAVLGITGVVMWIVLMVKAYNGERYKVPWAGDVAEMLIGAGRIPDYAPSAPAAPAAAAETPPHPPVPPPPPSSASAADATNDEKTQRKIDEFFRHRRERRITASAFAIAWFIILLVFFNFFYQYVAYYTGDTTGGIVKWTREPFFTNDIKLWLPILNTTLAISIISHIVMILVDKDLLRQALYVIMDGFGLATVITLLTIFPFDFNVIPNEAAATGTHLGVTIALIFIAVVIGISLLVRFIRLLINIGKAMVKPPDAA